MRDAQSDLDRLDEALLLVRDLARRCIAKHAQLCASLGVPAPSGGDELVQWRRGASLGQMQLLAANCEAAVKAMAAGGSPVANIVNATVACLLSVVYAAGDSELGSIAGRVAGEFDATHPAPPEGRRAT